MKTRIKKSPRGIVLVTVLFLTVFLVMFASLMLVSVNRQQLTVLRFNQKERALLAANSGINYALDRFSQDKEWCGYPTSSSMNATLTLTGAGGQTVLSVEETQITTGVGNIRGVINDEGATSTFYIFFADGSYTEADGNEIKPLYYSVNNLSSQEEIYSTDTDGNKFRTVPPNSFHLISIGKCGSETYMTEMMGMSSLDEDYSNVALAAGDFDINITSPYGVWYTWIRYGYTPYIRSKGNFTTDYTGSAYAGYYIMMYSGAKGRTAGDISINNFSGDTDSLNIAQDEELSSYQIPRLKWEDLPVQEASQSSSCVKLNAGTYFFTTDKSGNKVVKYYKGYYTSADDLKEITPVTWNSESSFYNRDFENVLKSSYSSSQNKLTISNPIEIAPVAFYNTDVAVPVYSGSTITSYLYGTDAPTDESSLVEELVSVSFITDRDERLQIKLENPEESDTQSCIIASSISHLYDPSVEEQKAEYNQYIGSVNIGGEFAGDGAVYTYGDISFEGNSQLKPTSDNGVSLYAKGNINLGAMSTEPTITYDANTYMAKALKDYFNSLTSSTRSITIDKKNEKVKNLLQREITMDGETAKLKDFLSNKCDITKPKDQESLMVNFISSNASEKDSDKDKITYTFSGSDYMTIVEISKGETTDTSVQSTDQIFKGLLFAGKNFTANLGTGKLSIQGAVMTYGEDPDGELSDLIPYTTTDATTGEITTSGHIDIDAGQVCLIYDPAYLDILQNLSSFNFKRIFWNAVDGKKISILKDKE